MDVVASLSRDSKIGPVRVNHKVWTTGDGTRKQGDVEISNFPISLRDGLVIDVSFVCEFKGSSRAPGGARLFKKLFFFSFITSLYVVSVEILHNTKFARTRDS